MVVNRAEYEIKVGLESSLGEKNLLSEEARMNGVVVESRKMITRETALGSRDASSFSNRQNCLDRLFLDQGSELDVS